MLNHDLPRSPATKARLALRKDTLTQLSSADLGRVNGGTIYPAALFIFIWYLRIKILRDQIEPQLPPDKVLATDDPQPGYTYG
jgi:hypothetical protein